MKRIFLNLLIAIFILSANISAAQAQIVTDGVTKDPAGGGGGGLTQEDINTPDKLNDFVTPDLADISGSQTFTNKTIDAAENTIKILKGTDCTTFDAAVDGQYCWDTDDDLLYVCETADVCDTAGEWDAVATGGPIAMDDLTDVTETTPQDNDILHYDTGAWVNIAPLWLPLAGGTLTGQLVADNLGIEFEDSDTNPTCSAGNYNIYADLSETSLKACTNGSASRLATFADLIDANIPNDITIDLATNATTADALSANPAACSEGDFVTDIDADGTLTCGTPSGSGDITAVGSCASGDCAVEGGSDIFPLIYEGTADTFETTFAVTDPTTPDKTITFPDLTGTVALSANKLDFFAATTSAELKGVISDETGSGGALVFATSPTLTTPTLGVASATSINKVAITAPATGSTLTIADGKTLTVSNTMSFAAAGDSGVFTLPNTTATLVGRDTTDTLTNKTISGASNTLSNIDWSSLINVPAFRKTLVQLRPQANEPPASSFATLFSRNGHPGLSFDGNVCAIWTFVLPNTYGGNGVTVDIYTVSSGTANDLDWDGSWERIETTQDIDSGSFATAVSADNNNNSATSGVPTKVSIAFTDGAQMDSCASGELCRFRLCRDDTADTTAATNGLAVMIGGQIRETP